MEGEVTVDDKDTIGGGRKKKLRCIGTKPFPVGQGLGLPSR